MDQRIAKNLRAHTQARLTLGSRGHALDTATSLEFTLDHARAREAVMANLDFASLLPTFEGFDLRCHTLGSCATNRGEFVRRPDLGRALPDSELSNLAALGKVDVALVLGDGLSAIAAQLNGPAFMIELVQHLKAHDLRLSPIILAKNARVALADQIAVSLGAETVVMALGERPGLSAADSLGVYLTQTPYIGIPDSHRNCLSNIREGGTPPGTAAQAAAQLIVSMRQMGQSGVALNQAIANERLGRAQ